uniref:Glyoxalase/bleomycin resistance protein/dioxygenase n=1 Tax=Solibacter usitatus (strain Ellin6076) TaxID=234267 RepID=Q01W78_SOLUE
MYASGNVTIPVTNMDRAVKFYTETLGLKLAYRFGDHFASVELEKGLTIGLHPTSAEKPLGERMGGPSIGLELSGKIEDAMKTLEARGVKFHGVADEGKAGKFAHFQDPDGNSLYLAQLDWKHVNQGEGRYQG